MAGSTKYRANQGREEHARRQEGFSSGGNSSSGKASQSMKSSASKASTHARSHLSANSKASACYFDGNRDADAPGPVSIRNPNTTMPQVSESMSKNLDLGQAAWSRITGRDLPSALPHRPAASTLGQGCKITLNTFDVIELPRKKVYQFEVLVGSGTEKRGVIKKVWESQTLSKALGGGFIFDGNRLAWSMKPIEREMRISVDLDAEQNRKPSAKKGPDVHRVIVRQTNEVGFQNLNSYLQGKSDFDTTCLEAINVLDHLVRETPRMKYTSIKRSFFARGEQRYNLSPGVEAFKGAYSSPRVAHAPGNQARLSVNLDVMNTVFWTESPVIVAAVNITGTRDSNGLIAALRQGGKNSRAGKELKKMHKLHVLANHRISKTGKPDPYCIKEFAYVSARDAKFEKDGTEISVYEYFAKEFNVRLQYPDLPLVRMTRGKNILLPMEVLKLETNQRYTSKLDEKQTSAMIKFAATPPADRWKSIDHGLKMLDWPNDPVLKAFGLRIDTTPKTVDGRVLAPPVVKYAVGEAKPGTTGRWDLKGKKFLTPNSHELKAWSVTVVSGRRGGKPDKAVVEKFIADFIKIYGMHGGKVQNKQPAFLLAQGDDVGNWVTAAWNAAGNQVQARPQMLVWILPDRDSITYGKIKRSAECRYGVVSQCMQYSHVQKCQAQYISNVCMKFNAKLGGITCRAVGPKASGPCGAFNVPTMIIGADVSHAAPGMEAASTAAMTFSMDKLATRYAAACQTNGYRVEMIQPENIKSMVKPMLQHWVGAVGGGQYPKQIIYFRDGVSEGQYAQVLEQEVADMKAVIKMADPKLSIPFIVVVGGKRHHIRFFPAHGRGDRNGNPLPGTLVETGVTHPRENDFYLCSHAAIKGTARPMHYHVLMNEPNISNDQLQMLIYEHCYQYIRATTPISQHPAIYYAHLASNRAVPHNPDFAGSSDGQTTQTSHPRSSSDSGGSQGGRSPSRTASSSSEAPTEFKKLLQMPNQGGIQTSMWYI